MGNRRTLLFLLCGICLTLLALYLLRSPAALTATDSNQQLVEQPLTDIEHITIDNERVHIGLVRQDDHWIITAPFSAEVNQGAVQKFLDALEKSRVSDSVSFPDLVKRDLSLRQLGLNPPCTKITLEGRGNRIGLEVGAVSPMGKELYLRRDGEDRVLTVSSGLLQRIPQHVNEIRSYQIFPKDASQITALSIRSPGKPFMKLVKNVSGWGFVQPEPAPADEQAVSKLLQILCTNRVTRFVWPDISNVMDVIRSESLFKSKLVLYGLDEESGTQLQVSTGVQEKPLQLTFGKASPDDAALSYVQLFDGESIGLVSNDVVTAFQIRPENLQDTRLFHQPPERIQRLLIQMGENRFILVQTNRQWRLESPVSDLADQATAHELANSLINLPVAPLQEAVEEAREKEQRFQPVSIVELTFPNEKKRLEIAYNDIAQKTYRIRMEHTSTRYGIAVSNMPPQLVSMTGLLSLHDKTMLSLSPTSLRRITQKRQGGEEQIIERKDTKAPWLSVKPAGTIDTDAVAALGTLLTALKAARIEKLNISLEDLASYGFREPWLELNLDVDTSDAIRKTILIGKSTGFGKRYAMTRGIELLFLLDEKDLAVLSQPLVKVSSPEGKQ
ncbi:MAG: DUF4340 domain-containing protein [Kiritimatiellae bacterium]|nr:DUF4340 domain-containing protein [Kiritimatiellia bacterium]